MIDPCARIEYGNTLKSLFHPPASRLCESSLAVSRPPFLTVTLQYLLLLTLPWAPRRLLCIVGTSGRSKRPDSECLIRGVCRPHYRGWRVAVFTVFARAVGSALVVEKRASRRYGS